MTHHRCPQCGRFRAPEGWVSPQRYMVILAQKDVPPPKVGEAKERVCDECLVQRNKPLRG